jgi:hypothetical protein
VCVCLCLSASVEGGGEHFTSSFLQRKTWAYGLTMLSVSPVSTSQLIDRFS